MKHVFTSWEGNQELVAKFYDRLKALNDEQLIEAYHKHIRLGLTGVHAQAVYVLALKKVMKNRFGKDIIAVAGGVIDLG